jgi:cyclohexa-1,5-dienecarbonyl-CoA hydratase
MPVRTAVSEGGIGTLTFANPPLNILTQALLAEMRDALARLTGERGLRVLILAADGDHFSAGADVAEHLAPRVSSMIPEFLDTIRAIAEFPVPVIAVVRGRCLGGGFEVAQAADLIVAGESASFGQPEVHLGVIAPAACVLLPGRCHPGLATEILFTGDPIDALRALWAGLVHCVVPDERTLNEATAIATRMARHSGAALRATKRALRLVDGARSGPMLHAAAALYLDELMRTQDAQEGLRAFLEKRRPAWKHA